MARATASTARRGSCGMPDPGPDRRVRLESARPLPGRTGDRVARRCRPGRADAWPISGPGRWLIAMDRPIAGTRRADEIGQLRVRRCGGARRGRRSSGRTTGATPPGPTPGAPDARRSAALPARPRLSSDRPARNCGGPVPSTAAWPSARPARAPNRPTRPTPTAAAPPSPVVDCGGSWVPRGVAEPAFVPRSHEALMVSGDFLAVAGLVVLVARRRDRGPGRVAATLVLAVADRGGRRSLAFAAGVRRLAPRPVLEGRADGEGTRQAVRLLVRDGTRRGQRFGEAAVAVVRARRARFSIVLERHERTGRCTVDARKPSLGHRTDDTRRSERKPARVVIAAPRPAPPIRRNGSVQAAR